MTELRPLVSVVAIFLNEEAFLEEAIQSIPATRPREHTCHQAEAAGVCHPGRPHPARRDLLDWIDRYMTDRGLGDDGVRQALDAALWP